MAAWATSNATATAANNDTKREPQLITNDKYLARNDSETETELGKHGFRKLFIKILANRSPGNHILNAQTI